RAPDLPNGNTKVHTTLDFFHSRSPGSVCLYRIDRPLHLALAKRCPSYLVDFSNMAPAQLCSAPRQSQNSRLARGQSQSRNAACLSRFSGVYRSSRSRRGGTRCAPPSSSSPDRAAPLPRLFFFLSFAAGRVAVADDEPLAQRHIKSQNRGRWWRLIL